MNGPPQPPRAPDDDEGAHPEHPRRYWDEERQCYVEAHTLCRDLLGKWATKGGDEPPAELTLFPDDG